MIEALRPLQDNKGKNKDIIVPIRPIGQDVEVKDNENITPYTQEVNGETITTNSPATSWISPEPSKIQKVLGFLSGGHMDFKLPPLEGKKYDDKGRLVGDYSIKDKSSEMGILEDPITALSFGAVGAVKYSGSLAGKLMRGATETAGQLTGGVTDIPSLTKTAIKTTPKITGTISERIAKESSGILQSKGIEQSVGVGIVEAIRPLSEIYREVGKTASTGGVKADVIPRRSDMIKEISNAFGVPIRTGRSRLLNKKALGIYKTQPHVIRLRNPNDIEVAAHEVGHHLQEVLGFPKQVPQEVRAMAYAGAVDTNKEGFSEFIRVFITKPDEAQKMAPEFFRDFKTSLDNTPDIKKIFDDISIKYKAWEAMPSNQKIQSYIKTRAESKTTKWPTFKRMYTYAVDEYAPLKDLTKAAESLSGKSISVVDDPASKAALMKGWARKAEQFLQYGRFNRTASDRVAIAGKPFKKIIEPVSDDLKGLDAYLVAKRAAHDPRIINGFDGQLSILDFQKTVADGKNKFESVAKELYDYQDDLLSQLVESGRISKSSAAEIRKRNLFYAPLYRVMDDTKVASVLGKKGVSDVTSPIKRLKGSSSDIYSPTENMVYNTYYLLHQAEKNRVGLSIANLAKVNGMGRLIEKVPTKLRPISITAQELAAKDWVPVFPEEASDILTFFRPSKALEKNEVVFYRDGNPEHYIIGDKDIYNAINSLDEESNHVLIKALSYPAKWLRAGATFSPEFILRNPVRDQMTAFVYSKYGYKPFWDAAKGVSHILKKDKVYQLYNSTGAAHASLVSLDRDYLSKGLEDLMKNKEIKDLYKKPLKAFQIASELMEEATRVSEFRNALKVEGLSPGGVAKSALASRDITLDFSRIGAKTKGFNQITAFFNAQVQGTDKLIRAFKERPKETTIKAIGGITIPTVALWYANKDDKYYQELPNWRKILFWNIVTHKEDGSLKNIWSIPKPFELGLIFGSSVETMLNYMYKNDKSGVEEAAKSLFGFATPGIIPTALTPLIENTANKSLHFDKPIVQRGREDAPAHLQYGPHTTETAKLVGRGMSKVPVLKEYASPAKIENLFRGWTGNLGYMTLQASDKMLNALGVTEKKYKPEMTLADIPGIKGFVSRFPSANSKSIEDFYRALNTERENYKGQSLSGGAAGKLVRAYASGKKITFKSNDLKKYEMTAETLSNLRAAADLIYETNMDGKQKRIILDKIYYRMINTARAALGKEEIKDGLDE